MWYAFSRPAVRHPAVIAWLVPGLVALAGLGGCSGQRGPTPAGPADPALLCGRIDSVLTAARDGRRLDASLNGAWQVVHGILAFGPDLPLAHAGRVVPAAEHVLGGGPIAGWQLRPGDRGVVAVVEEGSTLAQGHPDQWLGYLSQCGVASAPDRLVAGMPLDTPLMVAGRRFTLADLLAQARHDLRPGQEASWTLMALAAWLPPDASWEAGDGRRWTTEDVVRMEADAAIEGAACGGTHRLYALAMAVNAYRAAHPEGPPPGSGWEAAEAVLDDCIDRARRFQQADGGFSTHFFERPATSPDAFAQLAATGHVFEILAVTLDDDSLAEPWVTRAAERLVAMLERTADLDVECGALYHAAHGLAIYRRRICTPASVAAAGGPRPPPLPAPEGRW